MKDYYHLCSLLDFGAKLTPVTPQRICTYYNAGYTVVEGCKPNLVLASKVWYQKDDDVCVSLSYGLMDTSNLIFLVPPCLFLEVPCEKCYYYNNAVMVRRHGVYYASPNNETLL